MLNEVLSHLHNWFCLSVNPGTYTISGGILPSLSFLQTAQYFRIIGSVFNDGVYQYPATELTDETFTGDIWALAVPKELLELVGKIEAWCAKTENQPDAKISESFGGYSYSKAAGPSGAPLTWPGVFRAQLNRWRKI